MVARTLFAVLVLACALCPAQASAQTGFNPTNSASFRVTFSTRCQALNSGGRVVSRRLTQRDIIAQATGLSPSDHRVQKEFALAYNADTDSLQVVDAQGNPVVDVVHFGGGTATADARQSQRFTFMFFPGQTNEFGQETNVIGTALIIERARHSRRGSAASRASITGQLQFMLSADSPLGATQVTSSAQTNLQICVGVFTTGPRVAFPVAGAASVNTPGPGATNLSTTTITTITTPLLVTTTPVQTFNNPTGSGTTTTVLAPATGVLPTLTGNGALPDLGTSIGTGMVTLTPFVSTTPFGLGGPVTSTGVAAITTPTPIAPTTITTVTTQLPTTSTGSSTVIGTTTINGANTGLTVSTTTIPVGQ